MMKTQYLILEFPNGDKVLGIIEASDYGPQEFKDAAWSVSEDVDVPDNTTLNTVMDDVLASLPQETQH